MTSYPATREAGLARLRDFVGRAGEEYASRRNHVPGTVSGLSPYTRHRLVSEEEVAREVLARHSFGVAEKFLQEVCWRTYWKGWLEMRPEVWFRYLNDLQVLCSRMAVEPDSAERVQRAEEGKTGLDCFDDWSCELRETGYLHNHVRMWFASIWVHTLRLPWQLGADFFMRHLLDGDPASNTLSWRWVCGLQTIGKVYLATAENIERHTNGRYAPYGLLANEALSNTEDFPIPPPVELTRPDPPAVGEKTILLVTEEDLTSESWGISPSNLAGIVLVDTGASYSGIAPLPISWKRKALEETSRRLKAVFPCPVLLHSAQMDAASKDLQARLSSLPKEYRAHSFTIMNPPVGPVCSLINPILIGLQKEGHVVRRLRRSWDEVFWPHATHGFFKMKERIPELLKQLSPNQGATREERDPSFHPK
jgi:deoxyribodipyrimidine photo-lyase